MSFLGTAGAILLGWLALSLTATALWSIGYALERNGFPVYPAKGPTLHLDRVVLGFMVILILGLAALLGWLMGDVVRGLLR